MTALTREDFLKLDRGDQLAPFREEFYIPKGVLYMDGNSLGVMPKAASKRVCEVTDREWGHNLIKSWNKAGWFNAPHRIGDKIARIIGAEEGEVVATDSTGINLFKAISAALAINSNRSVIVMEGSNFPTDNYVVQGLVEFLGGKHQIRFVEKDGVTVLRMLLDPTEPMRVRLKAAEMIGDIGDLEAVEPLRNLKVGNEKVDKMLTDSLAKIQRPGFQIVTDYPVFQQIGMGDVLAIGKGEVFGNLTPHLGWRNP